MSSENHNPNPLQPEPQVEKSSDGSPRAFGGELPSTSEAPGPPTAIEALRLVKPAVPEDLRVPWGWWDLALFTVIAAIGFLTFAFLIIAVFQTAGISRAQFHNSMKYEGLASVVAIFLVSLFLLLYLALQLRIRFGVPFWRTLRWRPLHNSNVPPRIAYLGFILGGFLLSMLVGLVSSAFTPKNKMPIEQFLQDRHTALLLLALSVTLAPFFEETIFRGYIYPVVARTFGVIPGVLFTGLLFGLMHASQLGGNLPQVALLITVGIIFTGVRAKTGSVLPGYLVHISYNSFLSIAFLIASHGLRHMPNV